MKMNKVLLGWNIILSIALVILSVIVFVEVGDLERRIGWGGSISPDTETVLDIFQGISEEINELDSRIYDLKQRYLDKETLGPVLQEIYDKIDYLEAKVKAR